MEGSEKR
jgi:hypothetical protein